MPWLDLGELPDTYDKDKEEAFQVFMRHENIVPSFYVCKYD